MRDDDTDAETKPFFSLNVMDEITDHVVEARMMAENSGEIFLVHLLNMVLYEIGKRGADGIPGDSSGGTK